MSRLLDRLRIYDFGEKVLTLPDTVPIVVDNVARYWFEQKRNEKTIDPFKEFPNIAPCFRDMMFEYSPVFDNRIDIHKIGVSIAGLDLLDKDDRRHLGAEKIFQQCPDIRWVLVGTLFLERQKYSFTPLGISVFFMVTKDGSFRNNDGLGADFRLADTREMWNGKSFYDEVNSVELVEFGQEILPMFHPALLALSFMHCKNVQIVENVPDRKLSNKFKRHHDQSLTKYKTLVIEPMKKVLEGEGRISQNGITQALHICRGHFKTFGGEHKKLFGKVEGRYWWSQQARGTKEIGEVKKDYEVVK